MDLIVSPAIVSGRSRPDLARLLEAEIKSAVATRSRRPAPESKDATAKVVALEVKADSLDSEARTFTGLASTWDLDLGGDVIHRGAFKKTLQEWKSSGKVIPLLDSHNAWGSVRNVLGKMVEAKETAEGLETTFTVLDGPDGDEVWRRIKAGLITGLSIGYRPVKIEMPSEEEERTGVWRHLKEIELREVSVVLWPMNPAAQIDTDSAKSIAAAVEALEAKDELTDEEKQELRALHEKIGQLLGVEGAPATDPVEEPEAKGDMEPDDPARLDLEARIRGARLRAMGTRSGWKAPS